MAAVVTDASALIVLAKADLLDALPQQFGTTYVPDAVIGEILADPSDDPMRQMLNTLPWLERVTVAPPLTPLAYWLLGRGETEVIEYARLHRDTTALLDDRAARKVAAALHVPSVGARPAIVPSVAVVVRTDAAP